MIFHAPAGAYMGKLPTVEQVHEFARVINVGRKVLGLLPIGTLEQVGWQPDSYALLEFDDATPGRPDNCLSARHLADPAGFEAWSTSFTLNWRNEESAQIAAISRIADRRSDSGTEFIIPEAIRRVTDPFDNSLEGLREIFVEADYLEKS